MLEQIINDELNEIQIQKDKIKKAIEAKGQNPTDKLDSFAPAIDAIESGSVFDWTVIGYETKDSDPIEQCIQDHINYSETLYKKFDPDKTSSVGYFSNDTKLIFAPKIDISKQKSMASMFYGCENLKIVPIYDTSNINDMYAAFNDCNQLEEIEFGDTSKTSLFSSAFNDCRRLRKIKFPDASSLLYASGSFAFCYDLVEVHGFKNLKTDIEFNDCRLLSIESITELFNNVADLKKLGIESKTITLYYSMPETLDPDLVKIITDKGWVLAGA